MASKLFRKDRFSLDDKAFIQIVIWEVDPAVRASEHTYKYRMAYVNDGVCELRYDNEAGKGDHKHIGDQEFSITFSTIETLVGDFFSDVEKLRS